MTLYVRHFLGSVMLWLVSSKSKGPALSAVAQEQSYTLSSLMTVAHLTAVFNYISINGMYSQPLFQ